MNTSWLLPVALIAFFAQHATAIPGRIVTKEVDAGHLAELPCLSSDDHHRFMFWQLSDDKNIIGPGNPLDQNKYNYEVLTGKLLIRGVSTAESGFYKCISRGIDDNSAINIQVVELLVRRDWEDLWENDFELNLLRSLTAVMVIVVAIAVLLLIIQSKRRSSPKLFDMDASRESSPANYRENFNNTIPAVTTSLPRPPASIDSEVVDVDFPRVFDRMRQPQDTTIP